MEAHGYSRTLANDIVDALHGIETPSDGRSNIACALFTIVHEHHQAIVVLLEGQLYGSAAALLRSIFESYVRGAWVLQCASSKDISDFQKDKWKEGSFEDRLKELEAVDSVAHGGLARLQTTAWTALNSYTHSGMRAISRWFSGNDLRPSYAPKETAEIERLANVFAILAALSIAELSGHTDAMDATKAMAVEFKPQYPL